MQTTNADPAELEKFAALAHRWWDPNSEFKPLHDINPLRLDHIDGIAKLAGKRVLDVGCGGGILAESMATRGADVTGIDLVDKSLKVAQLHLLESGQPSEAVTYLERALAAPARPGRQVADTGRREEARLALEKARSAAAGKAR